MKNRKRQIQTTTKIPMSLTISEMRKWLDSETKAYATEYVRSRLETLIAKEYTMFQEKYIVDLSVVIQAAEKLPFSQDDLQGVLPTDNMVRIAYIFANKCSVFRTEILKMVLFHYTGDKIESVIEGLQETAIIERPVWLGSV